MKPRYTDSSRYPRGYTRSEATDVRATFRRIIEARKANAKEAEQKLAGEIKPRLKARTA